MSALLNFLAVFGAWKITELILDFTNRIFSGN